MSVKQQSHVWYAVWCGRCEQSWNFTHEAAAQAWDGVHQDEHRRRDAAWGTGPEVRA